MTHTEPDPVPPVQHASDDLIGEARQAIKQEAASFATAAQDRARSEIDKRRGETTGAIHHFADAIRRASDELEGEQTTAARIARQGAESLEQLSRTLSDKRPEELLDSVRTFAHRNPAAFIGASVLVGFAIGRFARASARNEQPMTRTQEPTTGYLFEQEPMPDEILDSALMSDDPIEAGPRQGTGMGLDDERPAGVFRPET